MSPIDLPPVTTISSETQPSSTVPGKSRLSPADEAKLKKAAGDFESILLANLWKSMKHSFGTEDTDSNSDPAQGTLDDWGIEIMSGAVGKAGGLGLGKLILEHLDPKDTPKSEEKAKVVIPGQK